MTKHWPERSLLAPPESAHLGENNDNQLDLCRNVEPSSPPPSCVARSAPSRNGHCGPAPMSPQQQQLVRPEKRSSTTGIMDKPATTSMPHNAHGLSGNTWSNEEKRTGDGKKKNYQRYPKPPYSYLAMIAMVIQRSPEKKLTLSEILKEISSLFPFFKGNYKGWRDSVRHNLSSYDCFVKVLKDPGKPQGKGNFWAVELSRVPLELLKRQNTAVSRQDETIFAQDLAPYILQGHQLESEPPPPPMTSLPSVQTENPPQEDLFRPKLDSSFAIDSLLHSLRPALGSGNGDNVSNDCWGEVDRVRPLPAPRPPYSSSARSISASSASPASTSSSSDEEWKDVPHLGKRLPPDGETGSGGYEDFRQPLNKSARRDTVAPPWELPTSYAKYAPPNAVAPPSMRFNGGPLVPLHGGLPLYSYSSSPVTHSHFLSHTYWPIIPSSHMSVQAPQLIMDLDSLLQTVPPNKSVFDVLVHTSQNSNHQPQSQFSLQSRDPLNRFHPY